MTIGRSRTSAGIPGLTTKNLFTPEEQEQFLALTPKTKEMIQRYSVTYHLTPGALRNPDYVSVGLHIENAIYGALYFGYYTGEQAWMRRAVLDHFEESILEFAPDMPLVLVKASAETIARRMKENPHPNGVLEEADIERVLEEFEAEFEQSSMRHKFTIDTTLRTPEETLARFLEKFEPYLNETDKLRILVHRARQRGEWI